MQGDSYEAGAAAWMERNRRQRRRLLTVLVISAMFLAVLYFYRGIFGYEIPLYDAALEHDWPAVQKMLEAGADPNETTDLQNDRTALMEACLQGRADMIKLLLSKGADPDIVDTHGDTPRDFAGDNPDIMAIPRQAGAKKQNAEK